PKAGKGFSTSKLAKDIYVCHLVTRGMLRLRVSS
ncbi:hypothetical protein DBR06_SOUSAS7110017, partial [Sousa chinensis]